MSGWGKKEEGREHVIFPQNRGKKSFSGGEGRIESFGGVAGKKRDRDRAVAGLGKRNNQAVCTGWKGKRKTDNWLTREVVKRSDQGLTKCRGSVLVAEKATAIISVQGENTEGEKEKADPKKTGWKRGGGG